MPTAAQNDTRTALLDHAEQAARARGIDGFSYADLAAAVGIRKASIHYHFPTKAGLTAELMTRYHARVMAHCATIDATHDRSGDRLLALVQFYRAALNAGSSICLCVALTVSRESLDEAVRQCLITFRADVVQWLQRVFALATKDDGITGLNSPEDEARATLALLEGAHLSARAEERVEVFDSAVVTLTARCAQ